MTEQEAQAILDLKQAHPLIGYNLCLSQSHKKSPGKRYLEVRPHDEHYMSLRWVNLSRAQVLHECGYSLFYVQQCRKFGETVSLWSCCECCPKEILLALKDVSSGFCELHYKQQMEAALQK